MRRILPVLFSVLLLGIISLELSSYCDTESIYTELLLKEKSTEFPEDIEEEFFSLNAYFNQEVDSFDNDSRRDGNNFHYQFIVKSADFLNTDPPPENRIFYSIF